MKYIIARNPAGILLPIVFDAHIRHKDIAKSAAFVDCSFVGAGIASFGILGQVICCGESRSMGMKPSEKDQDILRRLYGVE